jgi:hypothetical protein
VTVQRIGEKGQILLHRSSGPACLHCLDLLVVHQDIFRTRRWTDVRTAVVLLAAKCDSDLQACCVNTFTAKGDLSQFNNSCLKSPASTLVDLIFQSRCFSLNQLTCHNWGETCTAASVSLADIIFIPFNSLLCLHCNAMNRVYPYAQRESKLSIQNVSYVKSCMCDSLYVNANTKMSSVCAKEYQERK